MELIQDINCLRVKASVIVPVYNAQEKIGLLIDSLLKQDYPKEGYEIIIVDNGSTDKTKEIIQRYPVIMLEENDTRSSYAARNKGIKQAKGEILVFIDSDCIADTNWLREGIHKLMLTKADMVGGKVEFFYSAIPTPAQICDSITYLQFAPVAREQKTFGTCNLFVKRQVFDKIGLFPDHVKSGGDIQWTGRATAQGFKLLYEPLALVRHPARNLKELLKKSMRVGKGIPQIWKSQNNSFYKCLKPAAKSYLIPHHLSYIKQRIIDKAGPDYSNKAFQVWVASYLTKLTTFLGLIYGGIRLGVKS